MTEKTYRAIWHKVMMFAKKKKYPNVVPANLISDTITVENICKMMERFKERTMIEIINKDGNGGFLLHDDKGSQELAKRLLKDNPEYTLRPTQSGFVQPPEKTSQRLIQDVLLWPHTVINRVKRSAQNRRKREQIVRQNPENE
jgi:hypothetical protein